MLNAVAEILTGEKPPEVFEAKKLAALAAVETAREKYRDACLDAEEGDVAAVRRKNSASKELADAEARVQEIEAASIAARRRFADQAQKIASAERERLWVTTTKHAEARLVAAHDVHAAAATLREAFERLARESIAMDAACPSKIGSDGGMTMPPDLEAVLRLELVRTGFRWAAHWPWSPSTIPPLVKRIADSNAYVAKIREGQ